MISNYITGATLMGDAKCLSHSSSFFPYFPLNTYTSLLLSHGKNKKVFRIKLQLCLQLLLRFPPTWFSHLNNLQCSDSQGAALLSQLVSSLLKGWLPQEGSQPKRWALIQVQMLLLCDCEGSVRTVT